MIKLFEKLNPGNNVSQLLPLGLVEQQQDAEMPAAGSQSYLDALYSSSAVVLLDVHVDLRVPHKAERRVEKNATKRINDIILPQREKKQR